MSEVKVINGTAQYDPESGELIITPSANAVKTEVVSQPSSSPAPETAQNEPASSSTRISSGPSIPAVSPRHPCPNCGADLPHNARFCPSCGRDLSEPMAESLCPKCGSRLPYRMAAYCPSCGKRLRAEPSSTAGYLDVRAPLAPSLEPEELEVTPEEKNDKRRKSLLGLFIFLLIWGLIPAGMYFIKSDSFLNPLEIFWLYYAGTAGLALIGLVFSCLKPKKYPWTAIIIFLMALGYLGLSGFIGFVLFAEETHLAAWQAFIAALGDFKNLLTTLTTYWEFLVAALLLLVGAIVGLVAFIKSIVYWVKGAKIYRQKKSREAGR